MREPLRKFIFHSVKHKVMIDEDEDFLTPAPNQKIWRYMDFFTFLSLHNTKALYFSRADRLGDKFEGSL